MEINEKFIDIIDTSFFKLDTHGVFIDMNNACLNVFDRGRTDIIGKNFGNYISEKDQTKFKLFLKDTLKSRKGIHRQELEIMTKNGEKKIFGFNLYSIRNEQKDVIDLHGFGIDITGRKQLEIALKENEEQFRAIFEGATEGILIVNPETRCFVLANPMIGKMLGYSPEHLIGKRLEFIHPAESLPKVLSDFEAKLSDKNSPISIMPCLRSDGSIIFAEINAGKIRMNGHEFMAGFFRDITKLRQTEDELFVSRENFHSIVDKSVDGILILDNEGIIRFVNHSAEILLSQKREELIGTMLGHPLVSEIFYEIDIIRGKEKAGTTELRIAETTWKGEPAYLVLLHDITDRKQMEADIIRSNEDLEQFAYAVSHDLKEPVRVISNYINIIQRKYSSKLDENVMGIMNRIEQASERNKAMIESLLTYSRISSQQNSYDSYSSEDILKDAMINLKFAIEKNDTKITYDAMPDIVVDRIQFVRVFQNLINNAIKFCDKDTPLIHISSKDLDDKWLFLVKDNGIGIEKEYYKTIFNVFQKLHSIDQYPGSGIGLASVKKLIEHNGGEIRVESVVGEGSTFIFTIPKRKKG
jgi:PAS domain S-box-containing protein